MCGVGEFWGLFYCESVSGRKLAEWNWRQGKCETGHLSSELGRGHWTQGTGSRDLEAGNWKQGTGGRELEAGSYPDLAHVGSGCYPDVAQGFGGGAGFGVRPVLTSLSEPIKNYKKTTAAARDWVLPLL